jgi:hypothetical protein
VVKSSSCSITVLACKSHHVMISHCISHSSLGQHQHMSAPFKQSSRPLGARQKALQTPALWEMSLGAELFYTASSIMMLIA